MDQTAILSRLDVKTDSNGTISARCPAHDDKHASLSVTFQKDRVLLHCHAGCDLQDVLKALDLSWTDIFDDTPTSAIVAAEYEYRDAEGRLEYVVERLIPKSFRQRHWDGVGWQWNLQGCARLLFRLPQLMKAIEDDRTIFFVEGEKDVLTLESYGLVATCVSGGVNGWRDEHARWFQNARVVVLPDADEPGQVFARQVASVGSPGTELEFAL